MLKNSIFRAYDVRGKYPSEINRESVRSVAEALARKFEKGSVVLGRDARKSSPELYAELLSVFKQSKKFKIIEAGLITTPALYFLVSKRRASGGIMVTASHNPKDMNGLKMVGKMAEPISGEDILKLI